MTAADLLDDIDEYFGSLGRPVPAAELPQAWLANGAFTIRFPCGTHKTIRVRTEKHGRLKGKRTLALLVGPRNETGDNYEGDYEPFGELTPAGFDVWKRFRGDKPDEYAGLLWLLAKGEPIEGHTLYVSERCLRCNLLLTDPLSVTTRLGPECRRKDAKAARKG